MKHETSNQSITRQPPAMRLCLAAEERDIERRLDANTRRDKKILAAALRGDPRAVAHAANLMLIEHPAVHRYEYEGHELVKPAFHHPAEGCPFC